MTAKLAYKGTTILGFLPSRAPREECCSDPRYLCRKCARLALADAAMTVNCRGRRKSLVLNQLPFDPDTALLELPTIDELTNEEEDSDEPEDDEEPMVLAERGRRQTSLVLNRRPFDPESDQLAVPTQDDLLDEDY
jgi:hypothetical protein